MPNPNLSTQIEKQARDKHKTDPNRNKTKKKKKTKGQIARSGSVKIVMRRAWLGREREREIGILYIVCPCTGKQIGANQKRRICCACCGCG
jgi:hypothetical protein